MKQNRNYKYRLFPTDKQEKTLLRHFELVREMYNWILQTRIEHYEKTGETLSAYDINYLLPQKKKDEPRFAEVHSGCYGSCSSRIDLAFRAFFRRLKNGEKPGFPRFKGRDRIKSIEFNLGNKIRIKDLKHSVKLHGLGKVKLAFHRENEGRVKTTTIKREGLKWYIILSCEVDKPEVKKKEQIKKVGFDFGIKHFLTDDQGNTVDHIKPLKQELKKIQRFSRQKSTTEDVAKKSEYAKRLQNVYAKVGNQRKDFNHKLSRKLVDEYDFIAVEEINLKSMLADGWKHVNRHNMDQSFGQFVGMLTYKAEEAGCQLVNVNPAYTSQICSECGSVVKKDIDERTHQCEACGLTLDRDVNAARNILRLGLQSLAQA